MAKHKQRLTIVQYGGDFREASERLAAGGDENYRGQRYTVDFVEDLAGELESVTTITGFTDEPYDVMLPSGARAIGAGFSKSFDGRHVSDLVERTAPNRLILRLPSRPLLHWARRRQCRTMLLLADSFADTSVKGRMGQSLLRWHLRDPVFEVIANHGVRSANSLVSMGIDPARVIPYDFPTFDTPADRPAKTAPNVPFTVMFVGMLTVDKGVDDLVEAVAVLHRQGLPVRLDLVGNGETERVAGLIARAGIAGIARLTGVVANREIVPRMAAADAVVVPSRHRYSEGMPLTIYEAYCSRSPLVVSDHPMFRENVIDGVSGLMFRAGNCTELAAQITRLAHDPHLYATLSAAGLAAWERLQLPVRWGELIDRWLVDGSENRRWLKDHSVAIDAQG